MYCIDDTALDNKLFLRNLSARVNRDRVPFKGSIHLTRRCMLDCAHCYLPSDQRRQSASASGELETGEILRIIKEVADSGCLLFLITGGEPLLRDDFGEIYTAAKNAGLLVTVFTNGTLVTDKTVSLFRELPPIGVEISLYGAKAETHDSVTRRPGSFDKALRGARLLKEGGVRIKLKAMLLRENLAEFNQLEQMVQDMGIPFRMDATIIPGLDRDRLPTDHRVGIVDAVEAEFRSSHRMESWEKYAASPVHLSVPSGGADCGAGLNSFHIESDGTLYPCMMMKGTGFSLKNRRFLEGWKEIIFSVRNASTTAGPVKCYSCEDRGYCSYCPGLFALESEGEKGYIPYLCAMARERKRRILNKHAAMSS
jgi:radical SAM protein with 4Fe4S-binding SPASM domain